MFKYIGNIWLLIKNAKQNPKALAGYLVVLALAGLKYGLLQWFGIELPLEIEEFLRDNVLMELAIMAALAIASFYTRLINMFKEKWEQLAGGMFKRLPKDE